MSRSARFTRGSAALLVGASLLLAGCGDDDSSSEDTTTTTAAEASTTTETETTAPAGEITVSGAWARTSPAMTSAGAAYMEITNGTDTDDALISASVDASIAGKVEIHETTMASAGSEEEMAGEGAEMAPTSDMAGDMATTTMGGSDPDEGMMRMQPVDEIPVAAGATAVLEPGGYHIMMLDLVAPLEAGTTIEITLTFENAGEIVVEAQVSDTAP